MTTDVRLDVAPLPAPRPRFRVIRTKAGKHIGSAYSPANYKAWRVEALAALDEQIGNRCPPMEGPLSVTCEFVIQRPKKTVRVAPKGDVDNYVKALLDVLTEFGVWKDDDQVVRLRATKRWTFVGDDEPPHINFTISEVPTS